MAEAALQYCDNALDEIVSTPKIRPINSVDLLHITVLESELRATSMDAEIAKWMKNRIEIIKIKGV